MARWFRDVVQARPRSDRPRVGSAFRADHGARFTGSLSVAEAGRDDVRAMFVGALGCNLAWGIIDASLPDGLPRGEVAAIFDPARRAPGRATTRRASASSRRRSRRSSRRSCSRRSSTPCACGSRSCQSRRPAPPGSEDWLGAIGVFLLVFLSTFPVVIPFILMPNARPALRVSNAIAIALLFTTGFAYGRLTGRHPVLAGVSGWWCSGPCSSGSRWRSEAEAAHGGPHRRARSPLRAERGRADGARCPRETSTPAQAEAARTTEGLVGSSLGLHLHPAGRGELRAARRSRPITGGCTSKRASTTRITTPDPRGSATRSASARRSRWRSRR